MARTTLLSVVHPWHCDRMGHMNVRHYAAMFDDAGFQLLGYVAGVEKPGLGWADVRCEIDYRHETPAGTLVTIETSIVRLGRSSLTYHNTMTDTLTGQVHAEARVTSVRFDLAARKSVALAEEERQRAEALLV